MARNQTFHYSINEEDMSVELSVEVEKPLLWPTPSRVRTFKTKGNYQDRKFESEWRRKGVYEGEGSFRLYSGEGLSEPAKHEHREKEVPKWLIILKEQRGKGHPNVARTLASMPKQIADFCYYPNGFEISYRGITIPYLKSIISGLEEDDIIFKLNGIFIKYADIAVGDFARLKN